MLAPCAAFSLKASSGPIKDCTPTGSIPTDRRDILFPRRNRAD